MTQKVLLVCTDPSESALRSLLIKSGREVVGAETDPLGDGRGYASGSACMVIVHEPPKVDALARLEGLRCGTGLPSHAVLVVAPFGGADFRRKALRAGAMHVLEDAHLDEAALVGAVNTSVERFEALQEMFSSPAAAAEGQTSGADSDSSGKAGATLASEQLHAHSHASDVFTRRVLDQVFAFVAVLDLDGALMDANRPALEVSGFELNTVRGLPFWDCPWWSHSEQIRAQLRDACTRAAKGEVVRYEVTVGIAGGRKLVIDMQVAPLYDDQGRITHLIPSAVDISDRHRLEGRLSRLFQTNLLGVLFWDLSGGVNDANDEFLRIVGYDREDLKSGRINWAAMTPPEYHAQDAMALAELRTTGLHAPVEKEYIRKDGTRVWITVGSTLVEGTSGVGFVLDISERKRAEAALRTSEAQAQHVALGAQADRRFLDAVLAAAPVGIAVADANGHLLRMNPANARLWGNPPYSKRVEEYGGWKGWWADGSERHGQPIAAEEWALSRALRGENVEGDLVEIEPFVSPGTRRTTLNSAAPVRDANGVVIGGVVAQMDVTGRVEVESALRESEARARALADNMSQLAWMADETGSIFWYNRRWFEYTGSTPEEMKGWGWQSVHHPDHADRVVEKFRRHVETGEAWEDTFPLRCHDGEYRWFLSRAIPIRDEQGRVVRWFGTNTDVTHQREAEEALREADRRKDQFLAVLAHELRNPLGPVRTAVQLLRRLGPREPAMERAHGVIDRQVTHMARLIDDLLDVSRISRGRLQVHKELCDLNIVARQTTEDYRANLEAGGLQLFLTTPEDPVWVEGDPTRLAQMIGNILNNAGRFTETGGQVEVSVEAQQTSGVALVRVKDTGVGIDRSLLARLFDPFSQADQGLARSKGGLGLGLALTKGIAELHAGGVDAESDGLGKGATFTLRLPLHGRTGPRPVDPEGARPQNPLRVLVIEDNRDAAEMLADLVGSWGHEVAIAFDGTQGIALARELAPDVVLSDIGLPDPLNGYDVARALRAEHTLDKTRLIAISGYAEEEAHRLSRAAGFDAHLAKPPDLRVLEQLLSQARAAI